MTSAPHPTPNLSLGPQIEVLLFVPPERETGPAERGLPVRVTQTLGQQPGFVSTAGEKGGCFCVHHVPGVQRPGRPLRARTL